jgi:hypothetical protein
MRFDTTIEDFYKSNSQATFVDKMCAFLVILQNFLYFIWYFKKKILF